MKTDDIITGTDVKASIESHYTKGSSPSYKSERQSNGSAASKNDFGENLEANDSAQEEKMAAIHDQVSVKETVKTVQPENLVDSAVSENYTARSKNCKRNHLVHVN